MGARSASSVDGKPAPIAEIGTYCAMVDWNHRTVIPDGLSDGPHKVVVRVTGRKVAKSSDSYVQIVDIVGTP